VVLITTSNYAPNGLYPHGLQRQNFLPAIAMLERELKVLNLGNGDDYRLQAGANEPRYIVPADTNSDTKMHEMFARFSTENSASDYPIPAKKIASNAIWFDFKTLCDNAHGQSDYLAIAHRYGTVFLSGIPKLSAEQSAAARRFTWLIDVLYDHHVQLVASAKTAPENIYTSGTGAEEFHRTVSRLIEMQSKRYMQLTHRTQNITL
ncbi:MAG: cell division protein ZapE, partial [Gallionella sp.]